MTRPAAKESFVRHLFWGTLGILLLGAVGGCTQDAPPAAKALEKDAKAQKAPTPPPLPQPPPVKS